MCWEGLSCLSLLPVHNKRLCSGFVEWLRKEGMEKEGGTIFTGTFKSFKGEEVTLLSPADPGQYSKTSNKCDQPVSMWCLQQLWWTFICICFLQGCFQIVGCFQQMVTSTHSHTSLRVWSMESTQFNIRTMMSLAWVVKLNARGIQGMVRSVTWFPQRQIKLEHLDTQWGNRLRIVLDALKLY